MRNNLCTALLIFLAAIPGWAAGRPNFLFLFGDDQRPDTISAWGNPHIETPHIDRLVREGYSFRRNYCLGSNSGAVCVPSRAMLNSGQAYFRIPNNLEGVTILPELLQKSGYVTFATGKWHNQEPSWLRGFMRGKNIMFGGMSNHIEVPLVDLDPATGKLVNRRTGDGFSSEMFADATIEFLRAHDGEKPFYAYVPFTAPHDPRQPPVKYREMYYRKRPPLPPNFLPQHPFDNGALIIRDENLAAWPRTKDVVSDQLAEYYGMVTHLDEQIGRILKALEQSGQAENTYILYAADHGLAMGSHGLLGKQNLYEHSMGAPLVITGPGVPRNRSTDAFTYLLDLFPTILNLAGAAVPSGIDGLDLRPVWEGKTKSLRDSIFLAYQDVMRAVRIGDWKLIVYPQINHQQLFNLAADPAEMKNLAGEPSHKERIEALETKLRDWQKRLGDEQPLSVPNPKPKHKDLTGTPREPDKWQPQWIVEKYFGG